MATRNPVSVLPVPVGEATSTSPPAMMGGQAGTLRLGGTRREATAEPAGHRGMECPQNRVLGQAVEADDGGLIEAQLERWLVGRDRVARRGLGYGPVGSGGGGHVSIPP